MNSLVLLIFILIVSILALIMTDISEGKEPRIEQLKKRDATRTEWYTRLQNMPEKERQKHVSESSQTEYKPGDSDE
jgi:hypothetical protein